MLMRCSAQPGCTSTYRVAQLLTAYTLQQLSLAEREMVAGALASFPAGEQALGRTITSAATPTTG